MLFSLVGLAILATLAARAKTVGVWAAIALPLAWLVGGPVGEGQFFREAALLLAAVTAGLTLARRPAVTSGAHPVAHQAAPVRP